MASIKSEQIMAEKEQTTVPGIVYPVRIAESLGRSFLGEARQEGTTLHSSRPDPSQSSGLTEWEGKELWAENDIGRKDAQQDSSGCGSWVETEGLAMDQTSAHQDHVIMIDSSLRQRWRGIGVDHDLSSDSKIAAFLLNRYEESKVSKNAHLCSSCASPLSLICLTCHPVQNRLQDVDASLSTTCRDSDDDVHQEDNNDDDDCDNNTLSVISPAAVDTLSTMESAPADECAAQQTSESSLSTSLVSNDHESRSSHTELGEMFLPVKNVPENVFDRCFVKVVDVLTEGSVKHLQGKEVQLLCGEGGKRKVPQKNKKAARLKKAKTKKTKNSNGGDHKQTQPLSQDDTEGGNEFAVQGARPRNESPSKIPNGKEEDKPFKCSICFLAFKDRSNRRAHERRHGTEEDNKPHRCPHCPAAFRSQGNLVAHCRRHTGERPFSCEVCGKAFARSTTLQQHKRVHTDTRPYACPDCGQAFRQRGMVAVHRRKAHTFERPFACSECGATFVVKGHLRAHLQSHSGHRPFLCEECGASFRQKGILETHKLIHRGERPFSCDVCGKAFYRQVDVRSHKKTHLDVRDAVCCVCGAAFGSAGTLKRHMQRHTGVRPFPCPECGKRFASNSELKVHARTHSGDRPYVCDVCRRGFQTMGNMKKHRRNRHKHAPPYPAVNSAMGSRVDEGAECAGGGVCPDSKEDDLLQACK